MSRGLITAPSLSEMLHHMGCGDGRNHDVSYESLRGPVPWVREYPLHAFYPVRSDEWHPGEREYFEPIGDEE